MRTTLELDDDLVNTANGFGAPQGSTLGRVISDLAAPGRWRSSTPKYPMVRVWYRVPALQGRFELVTDCGTRNEHCTSRRERSAGTLSILTHVHYNRPPLVESQPKIRLRLAR